jgi:predicted AlkP superfamily phosphohydrolase/phosphomutase
MRPGAAVRLFCLLALVWVLLPGMTTAAAGGPKVLVIGFDGMDPVLLRQYLDEGVMPGFQRFLDQGGQLEEFGTAIPPQSPVAWSNFITGRDAGGHGIFDFIHRNPQTMLPYASTSEAKGATRFFRFGSWKIPRDGGDVRNLRQGRAFWEILADAGVDATIFKVPANFPPVECEARSLSGMGTPDITGNYGISTLITDDPPLERDLAGGQVVSVWLDDGQFSAELIGPRNTWREGDPEATVPLVGRVDPASRSAWFQVDQTEVVLNEGEWSDWITVHFPMVPLLKSVSGTCRLFLMKTEPYFRLYVTPIQIDPMDPEMPISTPPGYSREVAEATGLYYTQGLPDDTNALENDFFSDADFVQQSGLVLQERLDQLAGELDRFAALESGFLFFYFNSPDQSCHMVWRNMDASSPTHRHADPDHQGRIREVYRELDQALGLALDRVDEQTIIMVMSDHGFAPWNRAFHLNTWLLQNGYLHLQEGVDPEGVEMLAGVDWPRTRAYAVGINGLYLNLAGREVEGIVPASGEAALLAELQSRLEAVVDPVTGQRAVKYAYRADQVYHGPLARSGPDIVVGYSRGYRGSNESALGKVTDEVFADNMLKWSGDHCIAADEVPGIIMANRPIARREPELLDLAPTVLELFGIQPPAEMVGGNIFRPSDTEGDR